MALIYYLPIYNAFKNASNSEIKLKSPHFFESIWSYANSFRIRIALQVSQWSSADHPGDGYKGATRITSLQKWGSARKYRGCCRKKQILQRYSSELCTLFSDSLCQINTRREIFISCRTIHRKFSQFCVMKNIVYHSHFF